MHKISYHPAPIEGRVCIDAPYNGAFKELLKELVPSARWDGRMWEYDEEAQPLVTELVNEFYVNVVWKRVIFELRGDTPTIDGVSLAYIQRDYFRWKGDVPMKVVESDVESGGSRRHPTLSGRVVMDVLIRDGADIAPEPVSVEDAPETHRPDPLAAVPVAKMLKALHGREAETVDALRHAGWFVFPPNLPLGQERDELRRLLPHSADASHLLAVAALHMKENNPAEFARLVAAWYGMIDHE